MNNPQILKALESLAKKEYENAIEKFGAKHNSPHEAYAVMREELEEAENEIEKLNILINTQFWQCVKFDDTDTENIMDLIYKYAINGAYECLQLAAMAHKTQKGYEAEYYKK